jgi:putative addiction module component (TIGR02574 family)
MAKRLMTQATQALLEQVLNLPAEERAAIADSLNESFHGPIDPEIEAAWVKLAEERLDAYNAGTVKTSSVDEVFKRLKK